jgi:hypothetical protein
VSRKFCLKNKVFSFGVIAFMILFIIACAGKNSTSTPTYSISGTVTLSGAALSGVTINLTGTATASTTTDISGNFSFTGLSNGTYTITPSLTDHTFKPVSTVVVVSGASDNNINFAATATTASTYSISGTVSGAVLSGVTITLSGDTTGTATTDASGKYSFPGIVDGSYTVTPSIMGGYTFSPTNATVSVNGADVTVTNFAETAVSTTTYKISGTVTASGSAFSGVIISLTGAATASTTTDTSGNFSFTGLYNGDYTVTPVPTNSYIFTPSSTAVTISSDSVASISFAATSSTASTYNISGTVSGAVLSGVTITLSGAGSATTTTNASGNYSFPYIVDGSYTVTPSLTGYTFSPTNAAVSIDGADITITNFAED